MNLINNSIIKSRSFQSIIGQNSYRPFSGSIDKINDVLLNAGQQSIRYLKNFDKGNAKVSILIEISSFHHHFNIISTSSTNQTKIIIIKLFSFILAIDRFQIDT